MKNYNINLASTVLVAILLTTFLNTTSKAQNLEIAVNAEKTISGLSTGGSLNWRFKNAFAIGAFAQVGHRAQELGVIENRLYGMTLSVPIAKSPNMTFAFNLRSGVMNKQFIVVIPAVETSISLGKRAAILLGTSIRMRNVAAYAGMQFKLK